jgi:hypothetical protein
LGATLARRLPWYVRAHITMRVRILEFSGVLVIAGVLGPIMWTSHMYVTPTLFSLIWGWPKSSLVHVHALLPAIVVGVPFGAAFGLLPWTHPKVAAACAGLGAIAFAVAFSAYGFTFSADPIVWIGATELVLFVIIFIAAAYCSSRLSLRMATHRRTLVGAVVLIALTFLAWEDCQAFSDYVERAVRAA